MSQSEKQSSMVGVLVAVLATLFMAYVVSGLSRTVFDPCNQPLVGVEQAAHVLPRFERAEKQDVAVRWRRPPRRPVRRARRADRDSLGGDAQLPLHFDRGELRGHDDPRRAVRVIANEIGIVPANFRAGPFGMREEIEIVNRNDLRGVAGWQEERMQRVRHVEIGARKLLDGRPAEAVPREVQQANRHAPIDGARAAKVGRWDEAVLPRTGEDRQREVAAGLRSRTRQWISREQRLHELMRIFADAAPGAQRRSIVDQNAHLFKSFRLSILL